jgi:hypothetical protein
MKLRFVWAVKRARNAQHEALQHRGVPTVEGIDGEVLARALRRVVAAHAAVSQHRHVTARAHEQLHALHRPGQKPPFDAVKRPGRSHKSPMQNRFTVGNAKRAEPPRGCTDRGRSRRRGGTPCIFRSTPVSGTRARHAVGLGARGPLSQKAQEGRKSNTRKTCHVRPGLRKVGVRSGSGRLAGRSWGQGRGEGKGVRSSWAWPRGVTARPKPPLTPLPAKP